MLNNRRISAFCFRSSVVYTATGCADFAPPPGAWLERFEDRAIVRCNQSQDTWYLMCKDNNWVGLVSNCSEGQSPLLVVRQDSGFVGLFFQQPFRRLITSRSRVRTTVGGRTRRDCSEGHAPPLPPAPQGGGGMSSSASVVYINSNCPGRCQ